MSRLIEDLTDDVERMARSFLLAAHGAGLSVSVTSTMRTEDEQVALWAQGRGVLELVNLLRQRAGMKPISQCDNNIVTKCDGINTTSAHQKRKSMDVVLLNKYGDPIWHVSAALGEYKTLGRIAKENGFKWGGDFKPIDPLTGLGWDPFHVEV